MEKKKVLFVCTGNSARSQMAEGILRHLAGDRYEVRSAGTEPKGVHPRTVEVMRELHIDLGAHTSKELQQFVGQDFDFVITVCDRAKEHCPVFPGTEPIHWNFDDPADAGEEQQLALFRQVRDEIMQRVRLFVASNSQA